MTRLLEVDNLKIEFSTENGVVKAIRGVDLYVDAGETLAIVGESGSGKSVVTRAIMGILAGNGTIKNGSITYYGKDKTYEINKMKGEELRKIRGGEIAMIFQDPMTSLNPVMTIGNQIAEAISLHQKNEDGTPLSKEAVRAKVLELLDMVGIKKGEMRYGQYPHQFSGGMRQRIVIAIALGCDPKILIADEPTTALDVTIQAQILDLIKEIQKKNNFSVIFITHDLGVVAQVADRVHVMYAGRMVEKGNVNDVFYNPRHPYTWGLLASMPDISEKGAELFAIPGTPPNLIRPPKGDAFAARNKWAMEIDFEEQPPFFKVSTTHEAATWLLDKRSPVVEIPSIVVSRVNQHIKGEVK